MVRQEKAALCVGLPEVQAYARVETGEEEAVLAGLLRVASEMCESFINQALLPREFEADLRVGQGWTILPIQPVRSVSSVRRPGSDEVIAAGTYRVDVDQDGRGFIAGLGEGERVIVTGVAGMAAEANGIPEPIRQGILRLASSLFANRDGQVGELPKAVSALWRPYRRSGLIR